MSEYDYYVTYTTANDRIRERVEQVQRHRRPGAPPRRGRAAMAQRLHALADRIDG